MKTKIKLLLSIGSLTSVVLPIATIVSCGSSSVKPKPKDKSIAKPTKESVPVYFSTSPEYWTWDNI